MYSILVTHGHNAAEESVTHMLDSVYKVSWIKFASLIYMLGFGTSILNLHWKIQILIILTLI